MFYNKWELSLQNGKVEMRLDISDNQDRVERKKHTPIILPEISFVYFPRVDNETNEKYKKMLLELNIKVIRKKITKISELERALNRYLTTASI